MAEASVLEKLTTLGPRAGFGVAALAGAVAGLGQAPVSVPFASLLAFALIFYIFRDSTTVKRALWLGWAAGAGYFALTLSWIVEPFLVDIARHGWMAPFALLFSAVGFGVFWALAFALAHRVTSPGWVRLLALVAALSGAELVRSYLWTGFPWALIGHVWIGLAPMHFAALVGPHGLTLMTLLLAAGLSGARYWTGRALVLGAFAALWIAGGWLGARPVPDAADIRPVIRLVQPNAAQHLKWDPVMAPQFFARQLDLTAAPADKRPDLIVWPETSVPWLLQDAQPAFEQIAQAASGVPVVLGIQRVEQARAYNSLTVLDGAGQRGVLYDKFHLVPFGEYMPAPWLLRPLGFSAFTAAEGFGFSAGPGPEVLDLGPLGRALPLICYEAIFPQGVRASVTRPDWLLQITNDAWFGTVSGPYQHLAQARLRAVETGLPMVRVANTGVSAVIDARGRVTASLGLGEAGFLDAALPPAGPITLYYRTGDMPLAALLFAVLLGIALKGRRKSG